jgi:hypothetical protein
LHEDLRGEVDRLEREVLTGEQYLVELREVIDEIDEDRRTVRLAARQARTDIGNSKAELALVQEETVARTSHINRLQSDLKDLDSESRGLQAKLDEREEKGKQVRAFAGTGNRQYLTGLKMGGKRILILVDVSASMLDQTVVNVIRRRNLPDAKKRLSRKWRQAIKTTEWLVSQLPPDAAFQLVTFNVLAKPVLGSDGPGWIDTSDTVTVDKAVDALREVVPGDGTSLMRAIAVIRDIKPRPDNVFLLTDGLPTQGESKPFGHTVTGKQRMAFFDDALADVPANIPVNTILFPMEGDTFAASAFWRLTIKTGGSMISPSKDWP